MLSEKYAGSIRIAIVADPTGDLPGACKEGEHLVDQLRRSPAFEVASFIGPEQCRERTLFELIGAGAVDVLHYAGHGCFNPDRPETSGLLINGDADGILTAAEIRRCRQPPLLIFTNACQVGIVPPRAAAERRARLKRDRRLRARQPYGFAEALLQIGVRAYIGTFWSIPDDAAVTFARDFYRSVAFPNIDQRHGGSLKGMLEGLDAVVKTAGPNTKIVLGHGPLIDRSAVAAHRDMIVAIRDKIAPMVAKGMTLDQVRAARPTSDYATKVAEPGTTADRFVGQLYAELKK